MRFFKNLTTSARCAGATAPSSLPHLKWGIAAVCFLVTSSFFPYLPPDAPAASNCDPDAVPFRGYTFLHPDVINKKSAYAPYFLDFPGMYDAFLKSDLQRSENIKEWNGRFCNKSTADDIEQVVYKAGIDDMERLLESAGSEEPKSPLPYTLAGNTFAELLAYNGCTEAIDYLIFAKECEQHVRGGGKGWTLQKRDHEAMQLLIQEGKGRFRDTRSHFFKIRLAYQIVRLAHYCGEWQQTVDLYNELLPQIDRRKPSIVFFWTLGHLAGALQKQGKYHEAAYRYALIFRNCPSKRKQAFRSFYIPNDEHWERALLLCQSDAEQATLYALRAGTTHTYAVEDMEKIYKLDPGNPTLDLLLVSDVQQLEKILLRTPVTDQKYGKAAGNIRRINGAKHLLALQKFVNNVLKEQKIGNPKLWGIFEGYLQLLAGDRYAADKTFKKITRDLDPEDTETNDANLAKQVEVWRTLSQMLDLDPTDKNAEDAAFRLSSLAIFKEYPGFEPFMQDLMAARYAEQKRPGKAFMAAYDLKTLWLNPTLPIIDDLLATSQTDAKSQIEMDMLNDTTPISLEPKLYEVKGTFLWTQNQPEAALATYRLITPTQRADMPRFSPFNDNLTNECIRCSQKESQTFNRMQILEKIGNLEFDAKAAAATGELEKAAENYYQIGLAYYNMSWFGYEWEAMDSYRDPDNWYRLAKYPDGVFPMSGAPLGNRENIDVTLPLAYFEKALSLSRNPERLAFAAFMAAKCQQKQWFASPDCKYRPGSNQIPKLPEEYMTYYRLLQKKYTNTAFYTQAVKECKWLTAYARN